MVFDECHVQSFGAIRRGVVLFLGGVDDCADRVQLSSGTVAAAVAAPGTLYKEGARVPRPAWRSLTVADREVLIAESCPRLHGSAMSVIRLPPELLDPFRSLRLAAAEHRSKDILLPIARGEDCSLATDAIVDYLQKKFDRSTPEDDCALKGGIEVHRPMLQTITADPATNALIGLHVDNFYDFAVSRRELSPNRVCVNLGSDDRFFLFLNIPLGRLCKLMNNESSGEKEFMATFPSYPVVRVRIRPGEAYIAPTENILHDGSSIGRNTMDITFSVRGRFGLCPN